MMNVGRCNQRFLEEEEGLVTHLELDCLESHIYDRIVLLKDMQRMLRICISFSYRISLQVPWQSKNLKEEGSGNFQTSIRRRNFMKL